MPSGLRAGSVGERCASRWVPSRSRTNTQRSGTSPRPALYQWPVPLASATRRVPPPYQRTTARRNRAPATAWLGLGRAAPLTRGRPLPAYGGGGSDRVGRGGDLLTQGRRPRPGGGERGP